MIRFHYRWGWAGYLAYLGCAVWLWAAARVGLIGTGRAVYWYARVTMFLVQAERVERL